MPINDSDTMMLLHLDGAEGDTAIVDSALGASAKLFTNNGQIVRTQGKFGDSSLRCYGVDNSLVVTASSDFRFGFVDWTIDFWGRAFDIASPHFFAWYLDEDNLFALEFVAATGGDAEFRVRFREAGDEKLLLVSATNEQKTVLDTWNHFAIVREGQAVTLKINGVVYATGSLPSALTEINLQDWPLYIGRATKATSNGLWDLDGFIDEFRVQRAADYTAAFTPNVGAYMPRAKLGARGIFNVPNAFRTSARGEYGLALRTLRQAGRGEYLVRAAMKQGARGEYLVREAGFKLAARGHYGIGSATPDIQPYVLVNSGIFDIQAAWRMSARGEYAIHSGVFKQSSRGEYAVSLKFTALGQGIYAIQVAHKLSARGIYEIADTTLDLYELFHALGSAPDLLATPLETFNTLPHDTAAISGAGLHQFVLRKVSQLGFSSANIITRIIELDGSDNEVRVIPSDPEATAIAPGAAGVMSITSQYLYGADGPSEENGEIDNAADQWAIFITSDGVDPDPATDTPTLIGIVRTDGVATLAFTTTAFADGLTIKAIVRVRRIADGRESDNVNVVTATAATGGPAGPVIRRFHKVRDELRELA